MRCGGPPRRQGAACKEAAGGKHGERADHLRFLQILSATANMAAAGKHGRSP